MIPRNEDSKLVQHGSQIIHHTVSCLGLSLISGFGGLLGFYIPDYTAAGKGYADITHLMTYPTLFM